MPPWSYVSWLSRLSPLHHPNLSIHTGFPFPYPGQLSDRTLHPDTVNMNHRPAKTKRGTANVKFFYWNFKARCVFSFFFFFFNCKRNQYKLSILNWLLVKELVKTYSGYSVVALDKLPRTSFYWTPFTPNSIYLNPLPNYKTISGPFSKKAPSWKVETNILSGNCR